MCQNHVILHSKIVCRFIILLKDPKISKMPRVLEMSIGDDDHLPSGVPLLVTYRIKKLWLGTKLESSHFLMVLTIFTN